MDRPGAVRYASPPQAVRANQSYSSIGSFDSCWIPPPPCHQLLSHKGVRGGGSSAEKVIGFMSLPSDDEYGMELGEMELLVSTNSKYDMTMLIMRMKRGGGIQGMVLKCLLYKDWDGEGK